MSRLESREGGMSVPDLEPGEAGGLCPRSGDRPTMLGWLGGTGHHLGEGEGWLGTLHSQVSTRVRLTAVRGKEGTTETDRKLDHRTGCLISVIISRIEGGETQRGKMPPGRWKI